MILRFLLAALLAFLSPLASAQVPTFDKGIISIGTRAQSGSFGDINVGDYGLDLSKALQTAINGLNSGGGGVIQVLPGNYTALSTATASPQTGSTLRLEIRFAPNANVTIAHSGATGLLQILGCDNVTVSGGRFLTNTFVADQRVFYAYQSRFTVFDRCHWQYDTPTEYDVVTAGAQVNVSGTNTFALASGSWTTTPVAGQAFTTSGFTDSANNGSFLVVSATSSTVVVADTLVNETGTGNEVITIVRPSGSESTPMIGVYFNECVAKTVRSCVTLPAYAVTPIKSLNGNGLTVIDSFFQNVADAGLGGTDVVGAIPRLCYRVIDVDGDEWGQISRNKVWGLGDSSGLGLGTGINWVDIGLVRFQSNTTGSQGATTPEQGHWIVANNIVEDVAYKSAVVVRGMPSVNLMGNLFGFNWNYPDELGEAAVIVDDSNGTTAGGTNVTDFQMIGNDLHNLAESDSLGSFLYIRGCDSASILSNSFSVVNCANAIELASASMNSARVVGNTFRSSSSVTSTTIAAYAVHLNSGGGLAGGFLASGNSTYGFYASGGVVDNDSTVASKIFTSGLMNPSTEQPYNTTVISILGSGASVVSSAIIRRASGSYVDDGWQVGDLASTIGLDATAENGRVYVVAAVSATDLTLSGTPITTDGTDTGNDMTVVKVGGNPTANVILTEDT